MELGRIISERHSHWKKHLIPIEATELGILI
jgi:hypothetical protein